ncbi:MAG: hypothetical protein PHY90_04180 [Desulfitobacteriaceae bacterium]|nr:hypothetical protein [Desulfitobacteriaceae bacterium]
MNILYTKTSNIGQIKLKINEWFMFEENLKINSNYHIRYYLDFSTPIEKENNEEDNIEFVVGLPTINNIEKNELIKLEKTFSLSNLKENFINEQFSFQKFFNELKHEPNCIRVYNVGQALCCSIGHLCKKDHICHLCKRVPPIFYYDFGAPHGRDKHTYQKRINFCLGSKKNSIPIVLSHWHKDHWFGVHFERSALDCPWLVPEQECIGPHGIKLAYELKSRDKLNIWPSSKPSTTIDGITIFFCSPFFCSPIKKVQRKLHAHDTGLSILCEFKIGAEIDKFLLPGDNRYEVIPNDIKKLFEEGLDGLVATHHGGCYYSGIKCKSLIPTPNNNNNKQSKIVYSYGKNNSHNHPSYFQDYVGWANSENTEDVIDCVILANYKILEKIKLLL